MVLRSPGPASEGPLMWTRVLGSSGIGPPSVAARCDGPRSTERDDHVASLIRPENECPRRSEGGADFGGGMSVVIRSNADDRDEGVRRSQPTQIGSCGSLVGDLEYVCGEWAQLMLSDLLDVSCEEHRRRPNVCCEDQRLVVGRRI